MKTKTRNRLSQVMTWLPMMVCTLVYLSTVWPEWRYNEQYSYGFVVPLLAAYLIFLRWEERPEPRWLPSRMSTGLSAGLLMAAWLPLRLVLIANPDWRSAMWAMALLSVAGMITYWRWRGGWGWVRHFLGPTVLLLLAVPWPGSIEQPLVQELMRLVAGITVELLNLAGVYAEQSGNLIRLSTGLVGVEEACSGVRSLQSTLMAAFFLGTLYRFPYWMRACLIAAGLTISLLLNIGRTLTLTALTIRSGPQYMEQVHDPLGHAVAIIAFLLLLVCAFLFAKWRGRSAPAVLHSHARETKTPSLLPTIALLLFWLVGTGSCQAWFRYHEVQPTARIRTDFNWHEVGQTVTFPALPTGVRGMLRYSEGLNARWKQPTGVEWTVFAFSWDRGMISSFAGVHRPEVCLPSAGLHKVGDAPPLTWQSADRKIDFSVGTYTLDRWPVHVFYGMWNGAGGGEIPLVTTASERIRQAFAGQRVQDRHVLEIVLVGSLDLERSRRKVREFLDRCVTITEETR